MKKKEKTLDLYEQFWIFFFACFFGVVIETIYCLVRNGYIESRQGLIYGPFNLVYGIAALIITVVLKKIKTKNVISIFCISFVVGSMFEYVCSLFQEYVFGTVSWEYSHKFLNLNGRITLLYSIFWGLLGIVWVKYAYPKFRNIIKRIPSLSMKSMTYILLIFMIMNSLISFVAVYRRNERYYGISAKNNFERFLDEKYPDEFIDKIYPNAMRKIKNEK